MNKSYKVFSFELFVINCNDEIEKEVRGLIIRSVKFNKLRKLCALLKIKENRIIYNYIRKSHINNYVINARSQFSLLFLSIIRLRNR